MKHIFFGKTINGKPKISRRSELDEVLQSFEGKDFTLTIEKKKKSRSLSQNNFWWAVVIPMCQLGYKETGWKMSKLEVHEELLKMFSFEEKVNEKTGELKRFRKGSSELNTLGFMELVADVQKFAAEDLNVVIPDPLSQTNIEF